MTSDLPARRANLRMRACPRCGGDLYRDQLEREDEFVCLQCGRRAPPRPAPPELTPRRRGTFWHEVA
jgi:NADH pyrophosphatase NudC (nudix superfamily)